MNKSTFVNDVGTTSEAWRSPPATQQAPCDRARAGTELCCMRAPWGRAILLAALW